MIWVFVLVGIAAFVGASVFFGAPYVPSLRRDLTELFDNFIPLGKDDVLLDLGSGDGVVLREARRRGARAVGFEIHPLFAAISALVSLRDPRVTVRLADMWRTPFPQDVTLVYAFSVGRDVKRLTRRVQSEATRIGRPLRLVCYGNPLPGVEPVGTRGAYFLYQIAPLHPR